MRITHEMDKVINRAKEQPYKAGNGNFLLNGTPVLRSTVKRAKSLNFEKIIYCGTCGGILNSRQSRTALDLTAAPDEIQTCSNCRQEKAVDDGYDDAPKVVQVFQEWRQGRVALQKDPKQVISTLRQKTFARNNEAVELLSKGRPVPPTVPQPAAPLPPLTLELSPLYHDIHPVNYWRKPTRKMPQSSEYLTSSTRWTPGCRDLNAGSLKDGWYKDMIKSEPHNSPSRKFIKWINGFGMQEPWERVMSANDRLYFTSTPAHKRTERMQNDRVSPQAAVNFHPQAWSGFDSHAQQSNASPLAVLPRRKMRRAWAGGQDAPHFIQRNDSKKSTRLRTK